MATSKKKPVAASRYPGYKGSTIPTSTSSDDSGSGGFFTFDTSSDSGSDSSCSSDSSSDSGSCGGSD